ncbi:DnaJ domain-containing protein [Aspergillus multicolor]|uniref:DnaJ domain protein n=1 Tax=Aspergillus multicolor TaxID=41759 RepID=UPI003CCD3D3B
MADLSGPRMNCYEILEISPDASLKDINSSYKRLALRLHPDKTKGDDAAVTKFQKITEAVEVLRHTTTRRAHDKQLGRKYKPPTEEERLFASPDYQGWKPSGMCKGTYVRKDRYKFSYGESVHMNPASKESQEELARWERVREEEAEKARQEKLRQAAEKASEKAAKNINQRKIWRETWNPDEEELARCERAWKEKAEKKEQENIRQAAEKSAAQQSTKENTWKTWQSVLNPNAKPFGAPRQTYNGGAHSGLRPVWFAGAEPKEGSHGVLGPDLAGEVGIDPQAESERGHGCDFDIDTLSGVDGNATEVQTSPDLEAPSDTVPKAVGDLDSDVEPVPVFGAASAHHGESALNRFNDQIENDNRDDGTGANVEETSFEKKGQANSVRHEADVDIDTATEEHHSVYTASPDCFMPEDLHAPRNFSNCSMSGAWLSSSDDAPLKADGIPTRNADEESAESVYYDFSDALSLQSSQPASQDHQDSSLKDTSSAAPSYALPISVSHDFPEFDEANVYPHLAPLIPFFTAKLTDKDGRYSEEDLHGELKGMVMETYCGWLESLRVTIPGAPDSVKPSNSQDCRHLGYWEKDLGHEKCETCDLWKPIYMLVCPICGIKRCVRCKFERGQ